MKKDTYKRIVVNAVPYRSLSGFDMVKIKLECGHEIVAEHKPNKPTLRTVKCRECERKALYAQTA